MNIPKIQDLSFLGTAIYAITNGGWIASINNEDKNDYFLIIRPLIDNIKRPHCIYVDLQNIYIGSNEGLFYIDKAYTDQNKDLKELKSIEDFEKTRVENIIEGKDGEIIIATKGKGVSILKNNETPIFIDKEDGLSLIHI